MSNPKILDIKTSNHPSMILETHQNSLSPTISINEKNINDSTLNPNKDCEDHFSNTNKDNEHFPHENEILVTFSDDHQVSNERKNDNSVKTIGMEHHHEEDRLLPSEASNNLSRVVSKQRINLSIIDASKGKFSSKTEIDGSQLEEMSQNIKSLDHSPTFIKNDSISQIKIVLDPTSDDNVESVMIIVADTKSGKISELKNENDIGALNESIPIPTFNICQICFDVYDRINAAGTLLCGHEFCKQCVTEYLHNKISLNKINKITCAQEGCKTIYSDEIIKENVDDYHYQKMLKFRLKNEINQSRDMKWCINPRCELAIKITPGEIKVICECGTIMCAKCNHEFHGTKACKDIIEKDFQAYADVHEILKCPQCKNGTEKSQGCNHMTCAMCGYEWCWLCKQEYTQDHYDAFNPFGCPGLQDGRHDRMTCNTIALYGLKIAIIFFWFLWLLMVPIFILGLSFVWPILLYKKHHKYCGKSKLRIAAETTGLFVLGLITFPIAYVIGLVLAIVPGSCITIHRLIKKRRRAREVIRARRNQNIRRTTNQPFINHDAQNEQIFLEVQPQYLV